MTTPGAAVSEAVARPVRGLAQSGLGWVITDIIDAFNLYHFTERQFGLSVLVLGSLASAIQNLGENKGWWKPFLRQVPPKTVPVIDDTPGAAA